MHMAYLFEDNIDKLILKKKTHLTNQKPSTMIDKIKFL